VGDEAVWIAEQMEQQFGTQAEYLVDFYHLGDYLAPAGEAIAGADTKADWLEEKKPWLKENRWPEVLDSLHPFLEESSVDNAQAPVRACSRYISNRSRFLEDKARWRRACPSIPSSADPLEQLVEQDLLSLFESYCLLATKRFAADRRLRVW
jgi:hypothetical protein